jgi:Mg-chelatase subunit ChlD
VVTFGETRPLVRTAASLASEREALERGLAELHASGPYGATDLGAAVAAARAELAAAETEAERRMLVVTDGLANHPALLPRGRELEPAVRQIRAAQADGIEVHVVFLRPRDVSETDAAQAQAVAHQLGTVLGTSVPQVEGANLYEALRAALEAPRKQSPIETETTVP